MKLIRMSILAASALALAAGAAYAKDEDPPGFNALDKNDDGALSKAEAAGNPKLAAEFAEVDRDNDGKLSRMEYLRTMAVKDFNRAKEAVVDFVSGDDKDKPSTGK